MNNLRLVYLWLDGYETPNIRSKTKYIKFDTSNFGFTRAEDFDLDNVPEWGFDGSSTMQAEGDNSDCVLKPVKLYDHPFPNEFADNSFIVLCEVYNKDGSPHKSNTRSKLVKLAEQYKDSEMWFGIEQEYVFMDPKTERPYGWPDKGFPSPQGRYYCGVGGDVTTLRGVVDTHASICNELGIPIGGTNAEVMLSQWEYQIGTANPIDVCDDLWIARYVLESIAQREGAYVSLVPKPIQGDWNGSGAHINFSTKRLREEGGEQYITNIIKLLMDSHEEHIDEYGIDNELRLTGEHETQHIDVFSSGDSDRGASVRIPPATAENYKGYLEDRRPAANMDPYRAVGKLVETVGTVDCLVGV